MGVDTSIVSMRRVGFTGKELLNASNVTQRVVPFDKAQKDDLLGVEIKVQTSPGRYQCRYIAPGPDILVRYEKTADGIKELNSQTWNDRPGGINELEAHELGLAKEIVAQTQKQEDIETLELLEKVIREIPDLAS